MRHLKKFESFHESLKSILIGALMSLSTLSHGQDMLDPNNPIGLNTPISPLNPSSPMNPNSPLYYGNQKSGPSKEEIEFTNLRDNILSEINKVNITDSNLSKIKSDLSQDIHKIDVDMVIVELKSFCRDNNYTDLASAMDTLSRVDISKLKGDTQERKHLVTMISDLKRIIDLAKDSQVVKYVLIGLAIIVVTLLIVFIVPTYL
jgi:hypothetical protein